MLMLLVELGLPVSVVKVSSKYRIVIPQAIRKKTNLKPGQKLIVVEKDGVIHLIPQRPIKELRGFAKGLTTEDLRDETDRF
jgi:AbrB family looped-hinge helix DNA binding protein